MRDDLIPLQGKDNIRRIVDSAIASKDDGNIFIRAIDTKKYTEEQKREELEKKVREMRSMIYQVGTNAYESYTVSRSKYLNALKTQGSSIKAGNIDQVLGHICRNTSNAVSFLQLVGQIFLIPLILPHGWIDKARVQFERIQVVTLTSGPGNKDNFHKMVRKCVYDKMLRSINTLLRSKFGGHFYMKNPTKVPKKVRISGETCSSVDGCYDEGNGEGLGAPIEVTILGHPTEDPRGFTKSLWLRVQKGGIAEEHPKEEVHHGTTMDALLRIQNGGIPDDQGEQNILTVLSGLVKQARDSGVDLSIIQDVVTNNYKGASPSKASPPKWQCFIACDRAFGFLPASVSFYLTTDFHRSLRLTQKRTHLLCVHSYRLDQS